MNKKRPAQPVLRVLIVEDEVDLRDAMVDYLLLEGCRVSGASGVREALPWLTSPELGVVVLDLGLPEGDGLSQLLPHLDRRRHGLVLATSRGRLEDRIRGYDGGADAYLVKPVDLRELVSVIRGLGSRLIPPPLPKIETWTLNKVGWRLKSPQGLECRLTNYESRVLLTLASQPGEVVSKEAVIRALGQDPIDYHPRSLEIIVRRLRHKAIESLGMALPLQTAHGLGYAFVADIRVIEPPPEESPPAPQE